MKNIKLTLDDSDFRPAFVFDDVQNVKMQEINLPEQKHKQIVFKNVVSATLENQLLRQKLEIEGK
ncbi:hypothetical protein D3C83_255620 [compost metagenome]